MMFQAILLALAPVFFVMALGYGAGRLGVVDNRHVDGFNALVMDFALPASIFVATASAPRDETLAQAPLFAIFGGVMLAVYLGWYAFARISGGAAARLILSAQAFRPDWKVIGATIMGDVVRPLLTAAVVFTLPIPIETAKVAVLLAAVPAGFFGILFAVSYRLDSATAGSMVIASTVMSAVTLAVAIALLSPF